MADSCRVRTMNVDEVSFALGLARDEGWNPGVNDAACFHAADQGGFLVAEVGIEPVGCISAVGYGDSFGFIGLYIVTPDRRGQGHGMALWKEAVDRLKGRNIGLDGVPAQQDNYRKSGFTLAYRNIRYEGVATGGPAPLAFPLEQVPFEEVAAFDRRCFPEERGEFLKMWLSQPEAVSFGLDDGGRLAGYGLIRRCGVGWKIGPLFADTPAGARELFNALSARVAGQTIYLDIPEPNPEAMALVRSNGMSPVFETARMYTGPAPDIDLHKIYGVTTFELG